MTPDTYISRSPAVAARALGDEMVIMSAADSTLFSLSDVGAAIWKAADGSRTLSQIVDDVICVEFNVARDQALADALEFASEAVSHGILLASAHAPVEPAR